MPKTQPTIIKVGSKGAYVNLNSCVSLSVVKNQIHSKLREGYEGDPAKATPEDVEQYKADTLSFYFIGRDELVLRVGMEITQDEFDHAAAIIEDVAYTLKNKRVSVSDQAT